MRKFILLGVASVAALCAMPALAQTPGQWTVGDQGANWSVDSTKPTGAAPADAYEPAEVPLPNGETEARWTYSIGDGLGTNRCTNGGGGFYVNKVRGPTCTQPDGTSIVLLGEKKIRLTCGPSTAKRKDNLLGYGIRYFGHGHQGYGQINWNENTSYATIRADPRSSCQGIILNASNYMEPALKTTVAKTGAKVSVLAQNQSVYYIEGDQDEPNESTWIRRGMGWLWGAPPSDFNDTKNRAAYAAGGLTYPGFGSAPAGFLGWNCTDGDGVRAYPKAEYGLENGAPNARFFRGPGGVDAFEGRCKATANGPAHLQSDLVSPNCWDRTNLMAADARSHVKYSARGNGREAVCPKTNAGVDWARIPQGQAKNEYVTTGFGDYGQWTLTSDNMRMPTTECPDATQPCDGVSGGNVPATINGVYYSRVSLSPCRSTGLDFCGGETVHADYTFGWHSSSFELMERECLGITVRGVASVDGPAECNNGVMSRYKALSNNPPVGASFWSGGCVANFDCRDSVPSKPKERYAIIEGDKAGNVTIQHH